jgi:hypothetical protein
MQRAGLVSSETGTRAILAMKTIAQMAVQK